VIIHRSTPEYSRIIDRIHLYRPDIDLYRCTVPYISPPAHRHTVPRTGQSTDDTVCGQTHVRRARTPERGDRRVRHRGPHIHTHIRHTTYSTLSLLSSFVSLAALFKFHRLRSCALGLVRFRPRRPALLHSIWERKPMRKPAMRKNSNNSARQGIPQALSRAYFVPGPAPLACRIVVWGASAFTASRNPHGAPGRSAAHDQATASSRPKHNAAMRS
jgi:hypothetical protein